MYAIIQYLALMTANLCIKTFRSFVFVSVSLMSPPARFPSL